MLINLCIYLGAKKELSQKLFSYFPCPTLTFVRKPFLGAGF